MRSFMSERGRFCRIEPSIRGSCKFRTWLDWPPWQPASPCIWCLGEPTFSTETILNLGLGFQIAGAFGIAIGEYWNGFPVDVSRAVTFIPAECVWIVAFPLIVPNRPGRILASSIVAASMGPLSLAIAIAANDVHVETVSTVALYFLSSSYVAALIAYAFARLVYGFGKRLRQAREIGSYELVERIGEGGMGEVWRARHRLLARPAAIKLIRTDLLGSSPGSREQTLQRFRREAQETATLGSTHTIDVYDFGVTEDGDFYYVMELLNGVSLERFVKQFGPMEPARVVSLLQQVCHSLGEAHARGLVHRDIKPANIFLCRLGPDDDFVKVLDFGLVKHITPMATDSLISMAGRAVGTPAYMAPETALGAVDVDGRADIYSLGCVAYFLLTGQIVFARPSPMSTLLAHLNDQPEPLTAKSELPVPPALEALILECLSKDPAARPASAAVLGRRLAEVIPGRSWSAEEAHAWWELHRVSATEQRLDVPLGQDVTERSLPAKPGGRCWPKLDGTSRDSGMRVRSAAR